MATANTLTSIIPTLYKAADLVLREASGLVSAVTLAPDAARAAVGQSVDVPVTRAMAAEDITPAATPPTSGGQTLDKAQVTIAYAKAVPFVWTGEDQRQVNNGVGYDNLRRSQVAQAFRTMVNTVETTLFTLYARASRAYGTAGTTPFASDLSALAQTRKILIDNGASPTELQSVIDTSAGVNLRTLANLTRVSEAGGSEVLREGLLTRLSGFDIRESAAVQQVTKGTGSGYLVNNSSGYAIGDTAITLDTGSGTILAGDVVTFAGDTNKYVVATALASNVVTLAAPGLRKALADNVALTVGNSFTPNLCFDRNALILAARMPERPTEGDQAADVMEIVDPRTGLAFEVAMYPGYRQVRYEVGLAWGVACIRPEALAIMLG